jgi:tetratricopeptide (TPR) repeat protein
VLDDVTFGIPGERAGAKSEAIAEHWLDSAGSNRLFLFVHINEPHAPATPPDQFADLNPYDGTVASADEVVGALIKYLKRHQLYDQATIVLTSDHGEGLGDHGEQEHGLFLYDEAVHVPLIVKLAEGLGAGRRVPDVVQHIDVAPTILDLAKAPGSGGLRGRSLKPLLDGSGSVPPVDVYAEAPYGHRRFGWSEIVSLTDGTRRFIRAPQEEFYNLQRDPGERRNLLADGGPGATDPDAERMRAALNRLTAPQSPEDATVESRNKVAAVERYRAAEALAAAQKWTAAIAILQDVLRDEPSAAPVWNQLADLAMRAERYDLASDAADRAIELEPANPRAYLRKAAALLKTRKLDEAREQAEQARGLSESDPRLQTVARAMVDFADARALHAQNRDEDALALLEQAIAGLQKVRGATVPDLHLSAAETLDRLDRETDAEAEFIEELRQNPQNVRARAALAAFYQRHGRTDEAGAAIAEITRVTPTPDAYALAARLWASIGDRKQAEATRAEARQLFGAPPRAH